MGLDILEEREIKPDKLFPCETRPLGLLEGGQHQVITVLPGLGLSCTVSLLLEARALLLSSLCLGLQLKECHLCPCLCSLPPQEELVYVWDDYRTYCPNTTFSEGKGDMSGSDAGTTGINYDFLERKEHMVTSSFMFIFAGSVSWRVSLETRIL